MTGAAGFIGSVLGPFLTDRGHEVVGVDNFLCGYESNVAWAAAPGPGGRARAFTLVRACAGDAATAALVRAGDVVIHLGAISALPANQADPRASYANNVASTAGLLEACRRAGAAHFVLASTSAVYENTPTTPTRESEPIAPNLIYSLGKKHCEDLVRSFHDVYGVPFTTLRFFNVFGPNMDAARTHPPLVPYVIDCLVRGERPVLHSDGTQARDYIYVKDLVRLIGAVLDGGPRNTEVNVASGTTTTVRDIVAAVQRAFGSDVEPVYRDPALLWDKTAALFEGARPFPRARMVEEVVKFSHGDPARAKELLGWEAAFSLQAGVDDIVATQFPERAAKRA